MCILCRGNTGGRIAKKPTTKKQQKKKITTKEHKLMQSFSVLMCLFNILNTGNEYSHTYIYVEICQNAKLLSTFKY